MRLVARPIALAAMTVMLLAPGPGLPSSALGQTSSAGTIQGMQMLSDLQKLSDADWARLAGQDTNLPPHVNGHDEFEASWTDLALGALHDLPVTVVRQHFMPPVFYAKKPKVPATNVIVTVPGAQHPDQTVVVGCHPDGEPNSHGSAFDDASGCVIELALARVLGEQWRQQGLPALTVQFDLFDAEEQGITGSINYLFHERHGALMPKPVFMIDEEQSGIGYPVRPFGLVGNDTLPTYAITTANNPSADLDTFTYDLIGGEMGDFRNPRKADLALALSRVLAARAAAFTSMQSAYSSIAYRDGTRDAFDTSDLSKVVITQTMPGGSDNEPFEADGLPTVTLAGDASFYDPSHPDWAFPFDQPSDTFAAMACDSGGSPTPSTALAAALDLELSMSESLVNDYAPSATGPAGLTAFSTVPGAGAKMSFTAVGSGPFSWSFGDGTTTQGQVVTHIFKKKGTYTVTLAAGGAEATWRVKVPRRAARFEAYIPTGRPDGQISALPWAPPELRSIDGCH